MSLFRRVLGGARVPKAKNLQRGALTPRGVEGHEDYKWFRLDELVRRCIVVNAHFSTRGGFHTVCEEPEVKAVVDEVNRRVNLDQVLFTAQVKRSIYGCAGFEVVEDGRGLPVRLLGLDSRRLAPELDEDWNLVGFTYKGVRGFYQPREVIYFSNLSLEADMRGLSDIEPLRAVCQARHELLRENFPEVARSLWAPFVVLRADTGGLAAEEAEEVVEQLAEVAQAGRSIAVNEAVEAQVVHLSPDVTGLNNLLGKLEEAIIAGLGTPRILLGRPVANRATAYAELEAYVEGVVKSIQRYFKREVEAQLYARVARALGWDSEVKHVWNPVRAQDLLELSRVVSNLWGPHGQGPLGGQQRKAWEIMGWNPEDAENA